MILKAAHVAPLDGPTIEDGCVEIEGERIARVGPRDEWPANAPVEDLGAVVLTPGLVNPHTHLELGAYWQALPPAPFWEWLPGLVRLRRAPDALSRERAAAEEWGWRSLRAGVTTVGDISRQNVAWSALKRVPIRKVCFAELLTIADHPARNPVELQAAVESIEEDALLTAGVSPHAPYTVPKEQIREAIALAARLNRPWTMHLAETPEEVEFLNGNANALPEGFSRLLPPAGIHPPGQDLRDFLDDVCGDGTSGGALAHVNYPTQEEVAWLSDQEHFVIYCPRAHRFFGHAPHRFTRLIAAGARVAIGTDSPASNDDVSLLSELRLLQTLIERPPAPHALLHFVTLNAAAALGLHHQIGSLTAGKQADIAAFPFASAAADPLEAIIRDAPAPTAVWVAGKRVV